MRKTRAYLIKKNPHKNNKDQAPLLSWIANVILFSSLLLMTAPAEANFFVSDHKNVQCNVKAAPANPDAWNTPSLSKYQCEKSSQMPCNIPVKQCTPKPKPPCPSQYCPVESVAKTESTNSKPIAVHIKGYKTPTYCPPPSARKIVVILYEGSLKNNIERIAREHGWCRVIWKVPVDYRWVGTAKVCGTCLNEILEAILNQFPVEATFYQANHVVVVTPRKHPTC